MHHPPLNSLFDLIWSILLEVFLVTQIGKYIELLIGNVAGKYVSHKYTHNAYKYTRRSR